MKCVCECLSVSVCVCVHVCGVLRLKKMAQFVWARLPHNLAHCCKTLEDKCVLSFSTYCLGEQNYKPLLKTCK